MQAFIKMNHIKIIENLISSSTQYGLQKYSNWNASYKIKLPKSSGGKKKENKGYNSSV